MMTRFDETECVAAVDWDVDEGVDVNGGVARISGDADGDETRVGEVVMTDGGNDGGGWVGSGGGSGGNRAIEIGGGGGGGADVGGCGAGIEGALSLFDSVRVFLIL